MENAKQTSTTLSSPLRRVDQFIGQRLKQQRESKNITLNDLASALRLPAQAIRLAEKGEAPIGALSLYEAGEVLEVPMMYFFEGYQETLLSSGAPADRNSFRH